MYGRNHFESNGNHGKDGRSYLPFELLFTIASDCCFDTINAIVRLSNALFSINIKFDDDNFDFYVYRILINFFLNNPKYY